MYKELMIGDVCYKLRLSVKNCMAMEKALGINPIELLMKLDEGKLPKLTEIIIIFQYMLQQYQHNVTLDKAMEIFDDYLAEGHNMFDIVPIFVEVFQESGLLGTANNEASEEEVKN